MNIRCPNCRARFSVPSDFINRVVECGGCETQFKIDDENIIHSKKVYPGEKKDPELNQFRRIPLDAIPAPQGMQTVNYTEFNHPEQLGPAEPQRVIAGIFGIAILLLGALLLFLASKPYSPLGGMPLEKKLVVAGFTSLLGFVFLVYANPRARIKASIIGLLLTAGVFAIPIYVKDTSKIPGKSGTSILDLDSPEGTGQLADPVAILRKRFLTQPLEKEQGRLSDINSNKKAYGVYLTDMLGRNKINARDYLVRETLAGPSSHPYPREDNHYLVVLTDVEMNFDQVSLIADKLGQVTESHPEIDVIVVKVNNELFVAGSADKLNDRNHPSFYELNRLELQSIDLGRVEQAVERLADSDAAILRSDISSLLLTLLKKPSVTFHDSVARALIKWSDDPGPPAEAGLAVLKNYATQGISPPEHLVRLVANHKSTEAIPTMMAVWESNPVIWDKELVKFGPPVEPAVLEKLSSDHAPLRHAAIKMLGQVGTAKSLPMLRQALSEPDPESRVLAERSIQQIESRPTSPE